MYFHSNDVGVIADTIIIIDWLNAIVINDEI